CESENSRAAKCVSPYEIVRSSSTRTSTGWWSSERVDRRMVPIAFWYYLLI
ncbi:hypothetical protein Pmar_PMAR006502, partial [Perkinsus marinus ATCC 50983]